MISPTAALRLAARQRPTSPHVMYQTWSELLFLHWKWDPHEIQRTLPEGLHVDTLNGTAWLGIVPFYMRNIRPRYLPSVPWVSDFLELNVRTYVHDDKGRPGVWFYSLDCNQPLAVWTARRFFHLPYFHSDMTANHTTDGFINYSNYPHRASSPANFRYRLQTESTLAPDETLEFFLLERYYLFAKTPGGIASGQVHHIPYPMVKAEVEKYSTLPLQLSGFSTPTTEPDHICGSPGVDVSIWPLAFQHE